MKETTVLQIVLILTCTYFSSSFGEARQGNLQGAQALLRADISKRLLLTDEQNAQINSIVRRTIPQFRAVASKGRGTETIKKLNQIRQKSQNEAVAILSTSQKKTWLEIQKNPGLSRPGGQTQQALTAQSLVIPSIDEIPRVKSGQRRPRTSFGKNTLIVKTSRHAALGGKYVILTDHDESEWLTPLKALSKERNGTIVMSNSLGDLYKNTKEMGNLRSKLISLKPGHVAIAPKLESYRENMHLAVLKLLSTLDSDESLDAYPSYLIASDAKSFTRLIKRSLSSKPMSWSALKPLSIGCIEDTNTNRYRSYQKSQIVQNMFEAKGTTATTLTITTKSEHLNRKDFPKLDEAQRDLEMKPTQLRQSFVSFPPKAKNVLNESKMLFMFGHGVPGQICGSPVKAYADIDLSNEIIFSGSCYSAASYMMDAQKTPDSRKRFAFQAIDRGANTVLGHMGPCGGFSYIYPVAEHVLEGLSIGEAYQRLMNAQIGGRPMPAYYSDSPPSRRAQRDPRTKLLYIIFGDPALVPVAKE